MLRTTSKSTGILRITRLELKKSRKKYDKRVLMLMSLTVFAAIFVAISSISLGLDSEKNIYTIKSDVNVKNPKFIPTDSNPDVYLKDGILIARKTDKSLAAIDELLTYLRTKHREIVTREFGEKAYPLVVGVEYVRRGELRVQKTETGSEFAKITIERKTEEERVEYRTPEEIRMPGLLERMTFAFAFIIPAYFASQVSSSSLLEDRMTRRLEVLLSACSPFQLLMGKILPYLVTSIIACTLISVYFGVPLAFVFAIPVIIFLFSAQHFIAVISRSYREATFLLLVASLFITIYVFIPAVFSGSIPISKISPITLMLEYRDGRIEPESTVLSFSHLLLMSAVLFYLTSKSMNIDILYERSVLSKFLALSQDIIKRPWHSFVCASFSIPFAFMIEFFLIILVFLLPPALAIPVLILAIALVEEAIKGLLISARPQFLFTIATALGFFTGEKILVLFSVIREYSIIFLGHYLILPLFLHLSTAILFRYSLRHGFGISLTLATLLHFTYNYLVVMFFAP